ncbi:hypothetical protein I312_105416 [Cryptococcus bacillisporus CA1280]|uniref:uncharacterized protein n=1 Tax=Cryptococcus bacillisporus CA1280 TaxID=1296109 RepID=UPI0033697DBD
MDRRDPGYFSWVDKQLYRFGQPISSFPSGKMCHRSKPNNNTDTDSLTLTLLHSLEKSLLIYIPIAAAI